MSPRRRNTARRIAAGKGPRHKRARLWQAMRVMRVFTADELQAVAEMESRKSVQTFAGQLRRAGYLHAQPGNHGRHEPTHYRLVRDSGPRVPVLINYGTAFFDPNTEAEHPLTGGRSQ